MSELVHRGTVQEKQPAANNLADELSTTSHTNLHCVSEKLRALNFCMFPGQKTIYLIGWLHIIYPCMYTSNIEYSDYLGLDSPQSEKCSLVYNWENKKKNSGCFVLISIQASQDSYCWFMHRLQSLLNRACTIPSLRGLSKMLVPF